MAQAIRDRSKVIKKEVRVTAVESFQCGVVCLVSKGYRFVNVPSPPVL